MFSRGVIKNQGILAKAKPLLYSYSVDKQKILFLRVSGNPVGGADYLCNIKKILSMNAPITPLGDRVLVEKVENTEENRSGIILPKNDEGGSSNIGTVIAVGPGRENDAGRLVQPPVQVGQKVIFSWGEKVEINSKEYHLISETSLLGILN